MPKIDESRAPWHIGELMTQLRGRCSVVGVEPRMRDGNQRQRDGVPQWNVNILYCADGKKPQLIDAVLTAKDKPDLIGKKNDNGIALGAMLWRMNGHEGWSYNLDGRLVGQFK